MPAWTRTTWPRTRARRRTSRRWPLRATNGPSAWRGTSGGDPSKNINACHLPGKQLSGSGTDLNNLATCARGANDWQTGSDQGSNNMKNYENQVAEAVNAGGQEVMYSVTAHYTGNRTVPNGFTLTAYGTNPDGTPGIRIDEFIPKP
ncbi:DNA/RNA non-specific endonuclease [Streptomyces sp. NBC_00842]|uniref:DNA/RNA non-specific endonuclease n=1 Tax=unclassified Streptomyces TaxID=2593676 RepID=UPI003864E920